jgi:HK97 family phage portal protein
MSLFDSGGLIRLNLNETRDGGLQQFENPSVPLSSLSGMFSWVGAEPTASGESVTDETAMQHLDVYAAVRVIAESCASLPLHLMERLPSGRRIAADADIYDLLTMSANPEMSAHTFKETMIGCLAAAGNCYAQIQWEGNTPIALWPLHPRRTEPVRLADGSLAYKTTDGMKTGSRYILPEDMIHVLLFGWDGLKGLSPIMQARQALGAAIAAEKYSARWFGNGARPSGIMSLKSGTLDPKTRAEIKDSWQREQGGQNQNKVAFIPGDWTFTSIGVSPEESQFLATQQFRRTQIAALFRLPPHYLGDTSRMSNNSTEQQSLSFVVDTLTPYLVKFENELNRKLLPKIGRNSGRFYYRFDVTERLRGDFKSTQDGYAVQRQWGLRTANEIRADMGLSDVGAQGDVLWCPVNMQDSARLLDTESLQDQPLPPGDKNPPVPAPGETNPEGDDSGSEESARSLALYTRTYYSLYSDAITRFGKRTKRDSDAITTCFRPLLQALAGFTVSNRDYDPTALTAMHDDLVDDAIKSMVKRLAKWPEPPYADADWMREEFRKIVRGIHLDAARSTAAAKAAKELETEEVNEDAKNE